MVFTFNLAKLSFQNHPVPKPLLASVWRRNASGSGSARDRVIDFGKHKGKMLGALPSSYLKWVSKNLRAREFEEWAILADQVLEDPVYQDRIQWEFAHNVLSGTNARTRATGDGVVSELLEISERFGWYWDWDKAGWRNVNFELLGTSNGGRIPRINNSESESNMKMQTQNIQIQGGSGRRRERRDRLRLKREASKSKSKSKGAMDKTDIRSTPQSLYAPTNNPNITNPFPGRQALLNYATPHSQPSS
ncbi:uncharacterized protein LOC111017846 [Momordica charantia]|uniref:Uncharacterized protein LOC111017846 n=1 Tax=Momordica charantia TaxID=3673 RepID=A0A6J1D6Q9_MOMCH|nr:uncharacterized protein LOC111017846 [Momordica charantia]